jgi:hypothetical protein
MICPDCKGAFFSDDYIPGLAELKRVLRNALDPGTGATIKETYWLPAQSGLPKTVCLMVIFLMSFAAGIFFGLWISGRLHL